MPPTSNPPATARLVGERVTARRGDGRTLTGVLLPARDENGPLRLHTDDGQVLDIAEGWEVTRIERRPKGSRRRTHCPEGRPLYRKGDLPATQLATATMLRRQRRRLADGQPPVATYWTTQAYVPLYAVADSVPMRPLPPARQEKWDKNRTCARCGTRNDRPFEEGPDGNRYCEPCQEPAAEAHWHNRLAADRAAAAEWARAVLKDPTAVLFYSAPTVHPDLRVETMDGQVLLWVTLGNEQYRDELRRMIHLIPTPRTLEQLERLVTPAELADQLKALQGRRLIAPYERPLVTLQRLMRPVGGLGLAVADEDHISRHWDAWIGKRLSHGSLSYRYNQERQPQSFGCDAIEIVAGMRSALHEMAEGTPSNTPSPEPAGGDAR